MNHKQDKDNYIYYNQTAKSQRKCGKQPQKHETHYIKRYKDRNIT